MPPAYLARALIFKLLKGHGIEADFLGFLQKLVPHESFTLTFELFRFWLRIRGLIHIRKTTPRYQRYWESPTQRISDTGSRQFPTSLIRGVVNSPHHWYAESSIPRITDTRSRRLSASPIWRVGYLFFLKTTTCINDTESRRLPAPVIRWVADSLYRWVGELPTLHITDTESRRLRVSLSWGVDDSADRWYGESLFKEKIYLVLIFRTFNS